MVDLFEQDILKNDRQSSKGNQLKWMNGNLWYKADYTGYEGLSEYIISHLLKYSTLSPEEYVLYDLEQIRYKETVYCGVRSNNFLKEGWQIITLERLFQSFFGKSLYKSIYQITSNEGRLRFLVEQVERMTGLKHFGQYLNKLFTIDAFFLNEDRHTHNIAVLMDGEGKFDYCPIFDNGAGLLSDITMDYPIEGDIYYLMKCVSSKTICCDFDEQLDISEELYGNQLQFTFTKKNIQNLMLGAENYSEIVKGRVMTLLYLQMHKYGYLFQTKE